MSGIVRIRMAESKEVFPVQIGPLKQSDVFARVLDDEPDEYDVIPIEDVDDLTMKDIVWFMVYHHENPIKIIEPPLLEDDIRVYLSEWDICFIGDLSGIHEQERVFKLLKAGCYYEIKSLRMVCYIALACDMKGKKHKELLERYGFKKKIGDIKKYSFLYTLT
jgi:hypothetical protein